MQLELEKPCRSPGLNSLGSRESWYYVVPKLHRLQKENASCCQTQNHCHSGIESISNPPRSSTEVLGAEPTRSKLSRPCSSHLCRTWSSGSRLSGGIATKPETWRCVP